MIAREVTPSSPASSLTLIPFLLTRMHLSGVMYIGLSRPAASRQRTLSVVTREEFVKGDVGHHARFRRRNDSVAPGRKGKLKPPQLRVDDERV